MPVSAPLLEVADFEGPGQNMVPFVNGATGDLFVWVIMVVNGVGAATYDGVIGSGFTTPGGWTDLSITNGDSMACISYAEITGGDGLQFVNAQWSASVGDKRYAIYRFNAASGWDNVAQSDDFQTSAAINVISENFPTLPSPDSWLVGGVCFDPTDEVASPASGWTEDFDCFQSGIGCGSIQNVDGANGGGWGGSCLTSQVNGGVGLVIEVSDGAPPPSGNPIPVILPILKHIGGIG